MLLLFAIAYGMGCSKWYKMVAGQPPYELATPETAIRPFQGWFVRRV
jgi:hypothetical protein